MIMETGYSYRWEMSGTKDTNISENTLTPKPDRRNSSPTS